MRFSQELLGFINSVLHKSYSLLFNLATPESTRSERGATLHKRYALLEQHFAKQPRLLEDDLSAATLRHKAPQVMSEFVVLHSPWESPE
ncbi:hypothetical protein BN2475_80026 [Paraburkholderia ribeironis]|uniref:Uncharacterized protein n=1 Tax=Paraburkholderia ribeironis TaxID=1247936 RepID=A0A1N7RM46_9BURK|nr:hypothetical protein [Paraburkholderia ribeironis]SIT36199.1 hypothetical protein BN2475_80026 [Paraburkholderia ribeironis]